MILITGANGLLGSFIANHLAESGMEVVGLVRATSDLSLLKRDNPNLFLEQGDIIDIPSLISLFEKHDIKKVVHAAAIVSFLRKDKYLMEKVNVEGTRNILNIAAKYKVQKFIHISSVAALGRAYRGQLDETAVWKNSAYNTTYGLTKHDAELEVWRAQVEGLSTVILNPSLILAPATGRTSGRFFDYLLKQPKFYPTGKLNYVDVRDVASLVHLFLSNSIENERFIVNAGTISYKDFFDKAAQKKGLRAPSIPVKKVFGRMALIGETLRSKLLGKEPLLTSESLRSSRSKVSFDNTKIITQTDYNFKSLEETIDWVWSNF